MAVVESVEVGHYALLGVCLNLFGPVRLELGVRVVARGLRCGVVVWLIGLETPIYGDSSSQAAEPDRGRGWRAQSLLPSLRALARPRTVRPS